jgi:hypothetical protein
MKQSIENLTESVLYKWLMLVKNIQISLTVLLPDLVAQFELFILYLAISAM